MAARKVLIGVAVLALGGGVLASVANAAPLCGSKACRDEAAASGLTDVARRACLKSLISDCQAGLCSCTGGSPPCSCVCGDGLCGPSEDCSTCPQDCGLCPTTTTTTTIPCSLCFLTATAQCLGPCSQQSDCGIEPNVLCLPVTEIQRIGITCECPTTTTTTSTSRSTTSTTTFPRPGCETMGDFPTCGGPCDGGQVCQALRVVPVNGPPTEECRCVLVGLICSAINAFACQTGSCPAGEVCNIDFTTPQATCGCAPSSPSGAFIGEHCGVTRGQLSVAPR
jgi:hypothetical protein